jgi:type I restriction enzyme S subunit
MRKVSLGKLFELKYGKSLRKDKRNPGHYPVYGSNGPVDFHDQFLVNGSTIVVGRKGSIGEVHLVTIPCWPIDTTYFVEPKAEYDFDLVWLYRLLKTLRLPELNRSAAIPGLNRDDVYRIEVPLPPLDDQIRIAHLLGKVEGLIAQRKQHLQQLDDLLKSVFLEMFGDYIKAKRETDLGTFITTLTDYHANGSYETLKKHVELLTEPNFALMVRTTDLEKNNFSEGCNYITEDAYNFLDKSKVFGGEIIVNKIGSAGKVYLMPYLNRPVSLGMNAFLIRFNKDLNSIFAYYFLTSNIGTQRIQKLVKGAVTKTITKNAIRSIRIPKVQINLQNQFAAIVEKVVSLKSRYQQSLADLESLYGALSQKAFKGELDLSRVPLPEQKQDDAGQETKVVDTTDESRISEIMERFSKLDMAALSSAEGRAQILKQWFGEWLNDTAVAQDLSPDHFWQRARYSALDYQGDDDAGLDFSLQDYDQFKQWLFDAIAEGRIEQTRNKIKMAEKEEFGNQIVLKKVR